jgi:hypothetical protein
MSAEWLLAMTRLTGKARATAKQSAYGQGFGCLISSEESLPVTTKSL